MSGPLILGTNAVTGGYEVANSLRFNGGNSDDYLDHTPSYASNQKKENKSFFLDRKLKLAVCGDWCNNGKVEGAFCSAYDLVAELKNKFF